MNRFDYSSKLPSVYSLFVGIYFDSTAYEGATDGSCLLDGLISSENAYAIDSF